MVLAQYTIRRAIPDRLHAIAGDGEERGGLEDLTVRARPGGIVPSPGAVADAGRILCYHRCERLVLTGRQWDAPSRQAECRFRRGPSPWVLDPVLS